MAMYVALVCTPHTVYTDSMFAAGALLLLLCVDTFGSISFGIFFLTMLLPMQLIMGNDLRNVSKTANAILTNSEAIAVNQDPMAQQGVRLSPSANNATQVGNDCNCSCLPLTTQLDWQVWARNLSDGSVAVGLYNKLGAQPSPPPPGPCNTWNSTTGGYLEVRTPETVCI
jgi:hypothetical protein